MNRKFAFILVAVLVLVPAIIGFVRYHTEENIVTVETTKVLRRDITSVVTASGEIKPKTVVSVGRNPNEPVVHFYVKEGDRVKKGQKLAELQNPQPPFDVRSVYTAQADGIVTNLPLHDGDAISTGALALPGGLMNIVDPNIMTAELSVDETDIFKIKPGQNVQVSLDALPDHILKGRVTEIGQNAIIRSTGLSVSQTVASNQEARDFKVVVTLENPLRGIRSGLSATAKIITGFASNVLVVPMSALTTRTGSVPYATGSSQGDHAEKDDAGVPGVFAVTSARRVEFRAVQTGLMSATHVQITDGLQEGDQIVTGSYRVLQTLRAGTKVKTTDSSMGNQE
jgi:HlyD family secretion protein